jgi:anti-anti-sigma factor
MLDVEVATRPGTAVCLPKGDLDATTLLTFEAAVDLCLGEPVLIVDLSGVQLIDGSGLVALVGVIRRAREQRTQVAVIVPPGRVQKVLGDAGFDQVVSVLETVDLLFSQIHDDARDAERVHNNPWPSTCNRPFWHLTRGMLGGRDTNSQPSGPPQGESVPAPS